MLYQRSLEIEQRLESVLLLIRKGGYSTPMMAVELGVSVPTISRAICALRDRGHYIRAEKQPGGWCYMLETATPSMGARPRADLVEARR